VKVLAVERLGQNASGGGLAGPARTREQIGVTLCAVVHRIAQCPHNMVLAAELPEVAGPIPTVKRLLGHGPILGGPRDLADGRSHSAKNV